MHFVRLTWSVRCLAAYDTIRTKNRIAKHHATQVLSLLAEVAIALLAAGTMLTPGATVKTQPAP